MVETRCGSPDIAVQGYQTSHGRALLLINKRNASIPVRLPPETVEARVDEINETTGDDPPESGMLSPTRLGLILAPFEVAVVRLHQ